MPIPSSKTELRKAIEENYKALRLELNSIPINYVYQCTMDGHRNGTKMSIHNLISYLVGWNRLLLKWNHGIEKSISVDFPETGFQWSELGKLAQKFYRDYEQESWDILLMKLDRSVNEILNLVDRKTLKELYGVAWYKKYTLGRMIQLNTSSPYQNARLRLRRWKKKAMT